MSTLAFDTHAFVKELTQAGMPEAQAEKLSDLKKLWDAGDRPRAGRALDAGDANGFRRVKLATKQDLRDLEERLRRDMKELELRLKHDLTLRLGSMMVVAVGVVAALVKLL